MKRPGYTIVGCRWTPDGQGGYVQRFMYEKNRPGPPAPPEHRPQRWAKNDGRLKSRDFGLLL